jgi:hypothetical protein
VTVRILADRDRGRAPRPVLFPHARCYKGAMTTLNLDESKELIGLYEKLTLAVERASSTLHMRGMDSEQFAAEDTKCVAIWNRIRALIEKKHA